ncbi:hypothetical protein ACN38_g788 [Penicillium nordicum]|uniref:Uncharacterized protein n=1 Tax=Penicillium nordicum TaxID=229535 RepID=A0A0M8P9U9_9EURO|nr:hypothetical protein ACN38_g788 [Penicillium nordicum]
MKTSNNQLKVIGEFKVPWVDEHSIPFSRDTVRHFDPESHLRILLAQPMKYMKVWSTPYGFLSTYKETIFLRQRHNGVEWVVDCSPVIFASDTYIKSNSADISPDVSLRECFFRISTLALPQRSVDNQLMAWQWVDIL